MVVWGHWEEEGTRGQEHMTLIIGGTTGALRVRSGSVVSPMSFAVCEPQFPQLQTGGYDPCQPRDRSHCCHSNAIGLGKAQCKW